MRWGVIILIISSLHATASEKQLFERANDLYSGQDYQGAIALYDSIEQLGFESAALFYNKGNAFYKTDQMARAILNYERALQLAPSDEEIKYNLKLANLRVVDKIEPIPEVITAKVWRQVIQLQDSTGWAYVTIILAWLAMALFLLVLFSRNVNLKRASLIGGAFVILISIVTVTAGYQAYQLEMNSGHAIVFAPSSYVKSEPKEESTDLFILHEGLKVRILEESNGWTEIRLADGKQGWIPTIDIETI